MGWQRFLDMIQNELNKLKGAEKVADKNTPSEWAEKEWEWAKKEGYLDGKRPKEPITREETAIVIKRLVDRIG